MNTQPETLMVIDSIKIIPKVKDNNHHLFIMSKVSATSSNGEAMATAPLIVSSADNPVVVNLFDLCSTDGFKPRAIEDIGIDGITLGLPNQASITWSTMDFALNKFSQCPSDHDNLTTSGYTTLHVGKGASNVHAPIVLQGHSRIRDDLVNSRLTFKLGYFFSVKKSTGILTAKVQIHRVYETAEDGHSRDVEYFYKSTDVGVYFNGYIERQTDMASRGIRMQKEENMSKITKAIPVVTEHNAHHFMPKMAWKATLANGHVVTTAPLMGHGVPLDLIGLSIPGFIASGEDLDGSCIDSVKLARIYMSVGDDKGCWDVSHFKQDIRSVSPRLMLQEEYTLELKDIQEAIMGGVLNDAHADGLSVKFVVSVLILLNRETGELERTVALKPDSVIVDGYQSGKAYMRTEQEIQTVLYSACFGFTLDAIMSVPPSAEELVSLVTEHSKMLTEVVMEVSPAPEEGKVGDRLSPTMTDQRRHVFFVQNDAPVMVHHSGDQERSFAPLRLPIDHNLIRLHQDGIPNLAYLPVSDASHLGQHLHITNIYVNLDRRTSNWYVGNRDGKSFTFVEGNGEDYLKMNKVFVLDLQPESLEEGHVGIHGTLVLWIVGTVDLKGNIKLVADLDYDETSLRDSSSLLGRDQVKNWWLTSSVGVDLAGSVYM